MKKILFISHEASRTGAPILLLNLVKWISEEKQHDYLVSVLFVKGGDLISEFNKYSETYLLYTINKPKNIFTRIKNRVKKNKNESFYKRKWDLIFSNTIVNGKIIETIRNFSTAPIVSYIHELDYSIDIFLKRGVVQGTLKYANFYICGSKLVKETLVKNYKIAQEKTKVVYSFINFKSNSKNLLIAERIKKELNIPKDAFVVGMMGSLIWRKGPEFFVETALSLQKENIYFLWIGANNQDYIDKMNYDFEKLNTKAKVLFIPPSSEYFNYYNVMDVFYLSSREDPYPMVMVEASSYGIPIICYKNAGGTQEFIDAKTGVVVPYGNTIDAANKIQNYYENKLLLKEHAAYIKKKSKEKHDIAINALQIANIINQFIT